MSDSEPSAFSRVKVGVHRVTEWQGERFFQSAPILLAEEERGVIPPISQRLPADPLVIIPPESHGPYGGNWNQFATGAGDVGAMLGSIEEGLVRWDPLMRSILPNLALKWEITNEGRLYRFQLRKGVKWSDGHPFTSSDILFWYEKVVGNRELTPVPSPAFAKGGLPMRVTAPDPYTICFEFAEPNGLFLRWVARMSYEMTRYPEHYLSRFHPETTDVGQLKEQVRAAGFAFWYQAFEDRVNWRNRERPTLNPWILEVPPPARRIIFRRNPYYWKVDDLGNQLPYIDTLSFVIAAPESINLQFIAGQVGMQHRNARLKNFPLLSGNAKAGGYEVRQWVSSTGTGVLMLNLNHKDEGMRQLIGDARFRQALSLAIDRHEINEAVYLGMGMPSQIAPIETSPLYDPALALRDVEYAPETANRLLDEIGLDRRDRDGFRLDAKGQPVRLTIEMFDLLGDMEALQLVAQSWTAVGIRTDVRQMARALFYARMPARLHDVTLGGNSAMIDPLLDYATFIPRSSAARHALGYVPWFVSNGARGEAPSKPMREVAKLYSKLEATIDEVDQEKIAAEILKINADNLWVIGLLARLPALVMVHDQFRNVPDEAVIFGTQNLTAPECYSIHP